MTDQDNLSKIKSRIRALREKTVANGCTEDEAIAAADKAAELLSRHGLVDEDLATDRFVFSLQLIGKRSPLEDIWFAAASFADCKAYYQRIDKKLNLVIFGRERDVLIGEYVLDVLKGACDRAQREFRKTDTFKKRRNTKTRAHALKAFQVGLSKSVIDKIIDGLWRRYGDNAADIYRQTKRLLDQQITQQGFTVTKNVRKLAKVQGEFRDRATMQGVSAGQDINVNAGVNETPREVAGLLS